MQHSKRDCASATGRKQSWTVLQQVCSGELLWMTGSAMQMRQRGLSSDQALQIELCAPES